MGFKVTIETKFKILEAIKEVERAASGMLEASASVVAARAREHVRPGVGPGPHPHRTPHVDTANLLRTITVGEQYKEGEALVREVGNRETAPYGKFLEVGWYSSAGNFFRYPWLWPAVEFSVGDIRRVIASMKL